MTDREIRTLTKEVRTKIKNKFKNASRFSTLSGMPYHFIQNAFKKQNGILLKRIEQTVEATDDKPIFDEVSEELINKVRDAIKGKDLPQWCRDNGVPHYWLEQFLRGEIRFKTQQRVARLLLILDIE